MNQSPTLPTSPPANVPPEVIQPEQQGPACAPGGDAQPRRRVLVVDDHPLLRYGLIYTLTGQGYECFGAEHGAAALAILSSTPVDLVVTDLSMPQMGGLELIARLASSPHRTSIPVVVVTGGVSDELRRRVLTAGARGIVARAASPEDLLRTVRAAVEAKAAPAPLVTPQGG